jgi:hypothetical protein
VGPAGGGRWRRNHHTRGERGAAGPPNGPKAGEGAAGPRARGELGRRPG